ncbi:MAG: hypothetical protein C5B59_13425 [Bacteroidetes bacterium]|nr:MAG: hypothetical protein C5B59_13425 [Bacteroidota bacterium]
MRSVGLPNNRLLVMAILVVLLALLAVSKAESQNQPYNNDLNLYTSAKTVNPPLRLNEINARAIRHFKNHFLKSEDEIWTRVEDLFVATFTNKGIITKVYYRSHGSFAYYVKYYSANSLHPLVRSMIMKKFADYSIDVVTEVGNLDSEILFIKIKNHSNIKTLQVLNENIEVIEDYANGGI